METRLIKKDEYQVIDSDDIYRRNVSGVWAFIDAITESDDSDNVSCTSVLYLTMFLAYLSLPVSLTIGAGIKTAMDVSERIPLRLEDINNMVETLDQLDVLGESEQVSKIALAICNFQGESKSLSNSCMKLQYDLKDIDLKEEQNMKQIRRDKENKLINSHKEKEEKKLNDYIKTNNFKFFRTVAKQYLYSFTNTEQKEIDKYVAKQITQLVEDLATKRVKIISDYLKAPHNAGKKMQHHILGVMQPIMEEMKPVSGMKYT